MTSDTPFGRHVDREPTPAREPSTDVVARLIGADPMADPGPTFWSDIEARLAAEAGAPRDGAMPVVLAQDPASKYRWPLAAAAAVVLLGAIGLVSTLVSRDVPQTTLVTAMAADVAVAEPSAPVFTQSPTLVLPNDVIGQTPVGYGQVVGLTADRSALYTVAAAPGTKQTCLESRQLQFYLQPLEGTPRVTASAHRIEGESVSQFATDGTSAAWVEFCEFGETWYAASIAPDGTLANIRSIPAVSGEQQFGNAQHLRIEGGTLTGWVYRGQFDADMTDQVEIDLATGTVLTRTEVGALNELELPGIVINPQTQERSARLADGRQIPLFANHGATFAHDLATDTLYTSVYAQTPGSSIIVASGGDVPTDFVPLGLREHETVVATINQGKAWLIQQSGDDCSSTILQRSYDGQDSAVLHTEAPIGSMQFAEDDRWMGIGYCDQGLMSTYHFGQIVTLGDGRPAALSVDTVLHMRMGYDGAGELAWRDGLYQVSWPWSAPPKSVTVSREGELALAGVAPSDFTLRAPDLPLLLGLWGEWTATMSSEPGAVLSMRHPTGAAVDVYDVSQGGRPAVPLAIELSLRSGSIPNHSGEGDVQAMIGDMVEDGTGQISASIIDITLDDASMLVHARILDDAASYEAARAELDDLLEAMTHDDS